MRDVYERLGQYIIREHLAQMAYASVPRWALGARRFWRLEAQHSGLMADRLLDFILEYPDDL